MGDLNKFGAYELRSVDELHPNNWNPNKQSEYIFERELASIRKFGFVVPVIIRDSGERLEIVDGEHRWRAAKDLEMPQIPCFNLGLVSRETAMQLTVALNEIKGRPDAIKLGDVLAELAENIPIADLTAVLPYTEKEMGYLLELAAKGELEEISIGDLQKEIGNTPEPTTTLVFCFKPEELHSVVEAMDKALGKRAKTEQERGYAFSLIALDFMAGAGVGEPE